MRHVPDDIAVGSALESELAELLACLSRRPGWWSMHELRAQGWKEEGDRLVEMIRVLESSGHVETRGGWRGGTFQARAVAAQ